MDSEGVLFKIDENFLKSKSELDAVYFTKPRMIAYYEDKCGAIEPAKKIFYFKEPKSHCYPINLNSTEINALEFSYGDSIQCELKYVMTSIFEKKNVENVKKIKIFTTRQSLTKIMYLSYSKKTTKSPIRISRYNDDLYIVEGNDDTYSAWKSNETNQQQLRFWYELDNNVLTDSLYHDPTVNNPKRSELHGVYQSSFGEFEIIYSDVIDGVIQAEDEFNNFDDMEALNNCRWVTTKIIDDCRKNDPLEYLWLWLRAYLTNANDICIAYFNWDGIINEPLVHRHISELPKEFKSNWKPSMCTGFLHKFLQEVNKLMTNNNVNSLNTVYEFYIHSDNAITYKIFENKNEKFVVTPEYREYCEKDTSN